MQDLTKAWLSQTLGICSIQNIQTYILVPNDALLQTLIERQIRFDPILNLEKGREPRQQVLTCETQWSKQERGGQTQSICSSLLRQCCQISKISYRINIQDGTLISPFKLALWVGCHSCLFLWWHEATVDYLVGLKGWEIIISLLY